MRIITFAVLAVLMGCGSESTNPISPDMGGDIADLVSDTPQDLDHDLPDILEDQPPDRTPPAEWNESILTYDSLVHHDGIVAAFVSRAGAPNAIATFDTSGSIIDYFVMSNDGELVAFDFDEGVVVAGIREELSNRLALFAVDETGSITPRGSLDIEGACFLRGVSVGSAERTYVNCSSRVLAISTNNLDVPSIRGVQDGEGITSLAGKGDSVFFASEAGVQLVRFNMLGPSVTAEENQQFRDIVLSPDGTRLGAATTTNHVLYDVSSNSFEQIAVGSLPADSDTFDTGSQVLSDTHWVTRYSRRPDTLLRVWAASEQGLTELADIVADDYSLSLEFTLLSHPRIVGNGLPRQGEPEVYWHVIEIPTN